jgi:ABC-type multidrug transport system fused ATPase/permease subunit
MSRKLTIAVVGHTNTGKTSLLRTLSRDEHFGQVSDEAATTQQVEGIQLLLSDGKPVLTLLDTPGLEDPEGLLDALDDLSGPERFDGPERVRRFLAGPDADTSYEQEAKVLRQMLASDAAIYVIDCREPVLGKYREELTILTYCAIPVLPVLNFVASPASREAEWREQLARVNLHAVVAFDTVVFDEGGERRLYEKLRTMLDAFDAPLARLIEDRRRQSEWLRRAAAEYLAELLIDTAGGVRVIAGETEPEALRQKILAHQEEVRVREQETVDALLRLFRFSPVHYQHHDLPLINGAWGMDLFNTDALKYYGIRLGGGAAAGAAAGATLDAATLGGTLGLGTLGGAALGALLGTSIPLRRRLWDRLHGASEWRVADDTLRLLALRQFSLVRALLRRGHAAQTPLASGSDPAARWARGPLPQPVREARLKPQWSRLNPEVFDPSRGDRQIAVQRLTEEILAEFVTPD